MSFAMLEEQESKASIDQVELVKATDEERSSRLIKVSLTIKKMDLKNECLHMSSTFTVKSKDEYVDKISFNFNKSEEKCPAYRNKKFNKKLSEWSCSSHENFVIEPAWEVDLCPYSMTVYDLSIKVNAQSTPSGGKIKHILESRTLKDYVMFQRKSIGRDIDIADKVSVYAEYIKGESVFKSSEKDGKLYLGLDKGIEVDELYFRVTTKKNQLRNILEVILPSLAISVFSIEARKRGEMTAEVLSTALLTIIFLKPPGLGLVSLLWVVTTGVISLHAYYAEEVANVSYSLLIPFLLYFVVSFCMMKNMEKKKLEMSGQIRDLIKGEKVSDTVLMIVLRNLGFS